MRKKLKNLSIDSGTNAAGGLLGFVIGGPVGAVVGGAIVPIAKDILSRALSVYETKRIASVIEDAQKKIKKLIDTGSPTRKDLNSQKMKELIEGTLLKASRTYQSKKLPLIANLLAIAPFTNTPIENLNQTLVLAEQLSYQQLCILSIIGHNSFGAEKFKLSDKEWQSERKIKGDERHMGVYEDINYLTRNNLVFQVSSEGEKYVGIASFGITNIIPRNLILDYFGRLLFNGLRLAQIKPEDFKEIIEILK